MTSHTHAMGMFDGGLLKLGLKETTTIHSHGFVMVLIQWHKVYKFSENKLYRPPMVASKEDSLIAYCDLVFL